MLKLFPLSKIFSLKKELSKSVEDADSNLTKAYSNYAEAKKRASEVIEDCNTKVTNILEEARKEYEKSRDVAKKLLKESQDKANEILKPAKEAVRNAEKEKYDAIAKFNEQCGPYQVVYTGDRAVKEFERVEKRFNDAFEDLFGRFFKNFF